VLAASAREVTVQLTSGERIGLKGDALRWVRAGLAGKAQAPLKLQRGAVVRVMQRGKVWQFAQWPEVEAALAALDSSTGRVRALVGAFDFTRQPFNHATQAFRQPGSAMKPLLYSAALEAGVMPGTVVDDLPIEIPVIGSKPWSPQNSDGRFDGSITLRDGLARSKNLVSVRVLQHVGVDAARDWAARFGLERDRQPNNLTLALGTGAVTPLQLAQAYAVFANGGWRVNPIVIERVSDAQGKVLFQAPPPVPFDEAQRALPSRNVFVMKSLLNDVTRVGTAARAQRELKRSDVYGKTGTTDEAVDAWFAGFHPSVAAVAWMGYGEPKSLGERESGGGLALPIWIEYMNAALKGVPTAAPGQPPGGVLKTDTDWRYSEWADAGWVQRIDASFGVLLAAPAPMAASEPAAPAASASTPAVVQ
jgi:penicillin-binding protein 1A